MQGLSQRRRDTPRPLRATLNPKVEGSIPSRPIANSPFVKRDFALRGRAAVHDFSRYGNGRRAAYVTDPDGHVVEFWSWDVAKHLRELAAGESPGSN